MKILYDNNNGKVYYSVYDTDWFKFSHTTNIPLTELEIDEVDPTNKEVCIDLIKYGNISRVDINGDNKYYIENDELHSRDDWEEYIEEIL